MLILTGDCRASMATCGPFDLPLSDPHFRDTALAWDRPVDGCLPLARALLRPSGSLQIFCSPSNLMAIAFQFDRAETATARTVRRNQCPPNTGPVTAGHSAREDAGPRPMSTVLYVRICHCRAIHPTEKPSPRLEILIRTSCPEGGLVGDWFAGSGAASEACRLAGRHSLGCEVDPDMAHRARARLTTVLPFHDGGRP